MKNKKQKRRNLHEMHVHNKLHLPRCGWYVGRSVRELVSTVRFILMSSNSNTCIDCTSTKPNKQGSMLGQNNTVLF